jgi:radical SAM protein with 4Fe4S-binding SPASM domain
MDEGLYLSILDKLRAAGSLRALVIMHQNEPLMDRSLPTRVRQAKQILGPGVSVLTVTNGSLLTPWRIDELLEAGVDGVHVSIDAVCEATFCEVRPGLDYATVIENTRALLDRSKAGQVTVRFLKQRANVGEEKEFTQYWRALGAHVSIYEAANRAGSLREFERVSRHGGRQALNNRRRGLIRTFAPMCTAPFLRLSVLWDGRVGACCEDWSNRVIVGDLSKQSLAAVWQGERMNRHRHMLWTGRYHESPSCRDCSIRFGIGQH